MSYLTERPALRWLAAPLRRTAAGLAALIAAAAGLFGLFVLLIFALGVCMGHDYIDVTVVNRTSLHVTVLFDDRSEAELAPGASSTETMVQVGLDHSTRVVAVDSASGRTVFSDEIGRDDLERTDYQIVITGQ
jgi:hypothetical protein